ncbi:flagellin [Thermodesulfovibrio yellowstonii]|uniref:flagellin N-terminal helical domain-containing protein n=1 Tax=Thermodesulfovibrio yellowstonii TaxID=28262 RepID=UPI0024B33C5E|nr:flagellin [Thermodesulfovibrio yellowstonii]MDI6865172.1 flagellin [Thermodesulfovibrio yellowstonii]
MALRVNFNAEAATTHTALLRNEKAMNKSLLRISTGQRILSAADDAAGLFIADQLATVGAALDQGNRNIQTGISALQIAETNVGQIFDKLQTIYTKAQSAANDINDPNARAALQRDIANLVDAIQKLGTDTEYNGIKLLDGTFANKVIHYGARADQTITTSIGNVKATNIGAYVVQGSGQVTSSATTAYTSLIAGDWQYNSASDTVTVAGVNLKTYSALSSVTGAVDAKSIADAINNNSTLQGVGISARAVNTSTASTEWSNIDNSSGTAAVTIRFYVGSTTASASAISITVAAGETLTLDELVSQINTQASTKSLNITATNSGNKLALTTEGETIGLEISSATGAVAVNMAQFLQGATGSVTAGSTGSAVKVGNLIVTGTDSYNYDFTGISTASAGLGVAATGSGNFYNLYSIDVTDNSGAELAIDIVNTAIKKVDKVRTQIGSVINNLQAIYDGQKTSYDNTKEAENVIRNTDFAAEMSTFTTMQIRMQAGVAMLAQANALPQLVLQLLR